VFLNMLIGMLVYQAVYSVISYEDNDGIDYLIASLPVSKKEYVLSRYVFSIVCTVVSIIIFILMYYITVNFSPVKDGFLDYKISLIMGITTAIVLSSALIPSILKFGIIKGRTFIMVLGMLIVFVPTFAIGALVQEPNALKILMKLNEIGIYNICLIVSVVALITSYFIAVKIYENKEIL
ncbi:MAG: ABC-2 transporter permease, partial [Peptostreptococcaceae bacterium]